MSETSLFDRGSAAPDIALEGSQDVAAFLAQHGLAIRQISGDDWATAAGAPRIALVAVEALSGRGAAPVLDRVRMLRKRWPMVDVVIHAPDAAAESVRDWLRAGARDVILETSLEELLETLRAVLSAQQFLPVVDQLAEARVASSRFEGMLSRSQALWDVFETCVRVAPTDANVLVCGETGTGKELLARAVHRLSGRKGPMVAVNCSSISEELIESELFGHEKGAFTGAIKASPGIFRHAEGGTVFLDEIGDMPETAQQSLLRVLEERVVRPVGAAREIPVDVRIVAATNVPLEEAVARGDFREDLFYRIDVIRLQIPALRERPEDVVYLFGYFAKKLAEHYGVPRPAFEDGFIEQLNAYAWPGNVRELENFAERVVLRGTGRPLSAADVSILLRPPDEEALPPPASAPEHSPVAALPEPNLNKSLEATLQPTVSALERRYLAALLERTGGRVQETARRAGISRRTLQRKMALHGLDKANFRGA
ncbi:MAG: sigma-54-dependent Fis family transcriptional regulator [Myxococcales bacterium]|nr:sigma-54-dependent Fis family transcriptional regulator [Myxococcales bacterium]